MKVRGRLILDDRIVVGQITLEGDEISSLELEENDDPGGTLPLISPGFVDVHVHGGGGHDAMGGATALGGMARHLLRHGVTSFLPTAVAAPLSALIRFADEVRGWMAAAAAGGAMRLGAVALGAEALGAEALGFNLEGPYLAPARRGAHDPTNLQVPADVSFDALEPLIGGLRLITIAPELPGALELIGWLRERGVAISMGHSAANLEQARAGYAAGGTSTTHLFNAMGGVDHHAPGLAVTALADDSAYVELIADGEHVHPALWPLITRSKPADRLLLVSDAISLAGTGDGRARVGGLEVEVVGQRVTLVGTTTMAGSVIALDDAVRNLVGSGVSLPVAVAAASRNPLAMLGITDRGRLAVGQRADLVELDDELHVRRVMRAGTWVVGGAD